MRMDDRGDARLQTTELFRGITEKPDHLAETVHRSLLKVIELMAMQERPQPAL